MVKKIKSTCRLNSSIYILCGLKWEKLVLYGKLSAKFFVWKAFLLYLKKIKWNWEEACKSLDLSKIKRKLLTKHVFDLFLRESQSSFVLTRTLHFALVAKMSIKLFCRWPNPKFRGIRVSKRFQMSLTKVPLRLWVEVEISFPCSQQW